MRRTRAPRAVRTLRTAALAGVLAGVLAGCDFAPARVRAPADSAAGEIAFELAGPGEAMLLVPVHINGEGPFDFILDTGATLTCIDESLATRLRLPERRGTLAVGAGVHGAGRVALVRVDSLRLGGAVATELTACRIDLGRLRTLGAAAEGLIGLNVLKSFRVTLDFQRRVLRLDTPDRG